MRTDYLDLNESYPPLADVHVRRAISYAIDRAAIVKSVLFGYGKPANSFLPPEVPYYSETSPGLQYDLTKAKAEMAKSKFPKGFKVTLLVGAGAQVESAMGQIIQQSLKGLGIEVDVGILHDHFADTPALPVEFNEDVFGQQQRLILSEFEKNATKL